MHHESFEAESMRLCLFAFLLVFFTERVILKKRL